MKNNAGGCGCCGEACPETAAGTVTDMTDRETGLVTDARRVYEGLLPSQFMSYFQNQASIHDPPASGTKVVYSIKGQGSSDTSGPVAPYDVVLTFIDDFFLWNGVSIATTKMTVTLPSGRYTCTESETEFFCLYYTGQAARRPTNDLLYEPGGYTFPPQQDWPFMLSNTPGVPFPAIDSTTNYFKPDFYRNTEYNDPFGTPVHGGSCLQAHQNNQDLNAGGNISQTLDTTLASIDKNYDCAPVFTLNTRGISIWAGITTESRVTGAINSPGYARQMTPLVWAYVDGSGNLRGVKGLDFVRTGGMDHDTAIVELEMFNGSSHIPTGSSPDWDFFDDPNYGVYGVNNGDSNCGAACGWHTPDFLSNPGIDPDRESLTFGTVNEQVNIHDVSIAWSTTPPVTAEPSGGYNTSTLTQNINSRCLFNKSAWAKSVPSTTETEIIVEQCIGCSTVSVYSLGSNPAYTFDHWLRGYGVQLYFADDDNGGLEAILNVRPYIRTIENQFLGGNDVTRGVDAADGDYFGWVAPVPTVDPYAGYGLEYYTIPSHPSDPAFTTNYRWRMRWVWDGSLVGGYGINAAYGTPAGGFDPFTADTWPMLDGADRQGMDGTSARPHGFALGGEDESGASIFCPLICAKKSVPTSTLQKGSDGRFLTDTITFSSTDFDSRYNKFSKYTYFGGELGVGLRSDWPYAEDWVYCNVDKVPDNTPIIDSATIQLNPPTP